MKILISNKELAEELHKPIIRKFNGRKLHSSFINNISEQDKLSDIFNLASNTTLNAKINDVKSKVPSITNLVTNVAFSVVGNRILKK